MTTDPLWRRLHAFARDRRKRTHASYDANERAVAALLGVSVSEARRLRRPGYEPPERIKAAVMRLLGAQTGLQPHGRGERVA